MGAQAVPTTVMQLEDGRFQIDIPNPFGTEKGGPVDSVAPPPLQTAEEAAANPPPGPTCPRHPIADAETWQRPSAMSGPRNHMIDPTSYRCKLAQCDQLTCEFLEPNGGIVSATLTRVPPGA